MAKRDEQPQLYQVKEAFTALHKGTEVTYLKGEAVHPDDPLLAKHPEHFEPLKFPHDPAALAAMTEPEPEPEPEPVEV